MSLDRADGGGTPTVVRFCRMRGCRPVDRSKWEPCSRCGTHQGYGSSIDCFTAAMRWHVLKVADDWFADRPDPFLAALKKMANARPAWVQRIDCSGKR